MIIRRGDVWLLSFNPVRPNEVAGTRPSVIVSNNVANANSPTVIVVPLTTNTERVYSFQLLIETHRSGLEADCKAQTEQVRAVSKARLVRQLSAIPDDLMLELDARLRLQMQL